MATVRIKYNAANQMSENNVSHRFQEALYIALNAGNRLSAAIKA